MSRSTTRLTMMIAFGMAVGLLIALGINNPQSELAKWLHQLTSPVQTNAQFNSNNGYANIVAKALPSVVSVYRIEYDNEANLTLLNDPHYQQFIGGELIADKGKAVGLGSGVIISHAGHILTNHHVIAGADSLEIDLYDGRTTTATVIGTDPATDLALLKIELADLQATTIVANNDIRVGDIVLAIGNPHGLGTSVSMGIISGLERNQIGLNTYENFIQIDAPINQGNSGGALIDSQGHLIGINTATSSASQGLGLAIPTSTVISVVDNLIQYGSVIRGWLGVEMNLIIEKNIGNRAQAEVLKIDGVYVNSPAHKAGLQPGDTIIQLDDFSTDRIRQAMDYVAQLKPGSELTITYVRQGQTHTTSARLGVRPASQ